MDWCPVQGVNTKTAGQAVKKGMGSCSYLMLSVSLLLVLRQSLGKNSLYVPGLVLVVSEIILHGVSLLCRQAALDLQPRFSFCCRESRSVGTPSVPAEKGNRVENTRVYTHCILMRLRK